MNFIKSLVVGLLLVVSGCASVSGVWEAGKTVVTGTVDAVVKGTTQVVSAVAEDVSDTTAFVLDTTAGVVEDVAEKVDQETDELQPKEEQGK
jgi:phage-related protein